MDCLYISGWFILLIAAVNIDAQKKPPMNIGTKCLGNIMRVDVGPLGGKALAVDAIMNNSTFQLTPTMASLCGFSESQQPGRAVIYASLHNCFAQTMGDDFTTTLNINLHGNGMAEEELHQVTQTCRRHARSSREIVCDRNYMEVSVQRAAPEDYELPPQPLKAAGAKFGDPRRTAEKSPMDAGFKMTSILFYTPEEKAMSVAQAQRLGYWVAVTPTRLVVRGSPAAAETYSANVANVPMTILQTSTIFEKQWLSTRIHATAACPTVKGSVTFTADTIVWFLPRRIDPLVSSAQVKLLEVYAGVNGERMGASKMAASRYSLTMTELHLIYEIPIGAVGGYYKSHVQDGQYCTCYSIEPMLELLWTEEGGSPEDTRYKVLLPITTPVQPHHVAVIDNTVPTEKVFKVLIGPLGSDVALMNISVPSEVLSVTDCLARGWKVLEHTSPNSSLKVFTLDVPFTDPVVQQTKNEETTIYSLNLNFGLLVLPDFSPFSQTANLEATLVEIIAPNVLGGCDDENFYILVKYGSSHFPFQTMVGNQALTATLAEQYQFTKNKTHFRLSVPFTAPDAALEAVESTTIRSRLDVALTDPETNKNIKAFTLACNFPALLTECFPNGTMTALAVKLESVPGLDLSRLTLNDPNCGPSYSDDRFAYFVFSGSSCGTTRKFAGNMMLYENEIALPDELQKMQESDKEEPEYEFKVSCYYDINVTRAVDFLARPRRSEPFAENAKGELQIAMRLALDDSFSSFHKEDEYPVAKYLQKPLYFEVELMKSKNPRVSVELENCWATLSQDRTSRPRWNLVIDGCANPADPDQVIFHPVWPNDRVKFPAHLKRFEVQMFAFAEDQENLSHQLFVHCDVAICDDRNPLGGVCSGSCSNQDNGVKGQRRDVSDAHTSKEVSSGPIIIS